MAALSLGYTPGNKPLYGRLDSKFKSHEITENYPDFSDLETDVRLKNWMDKCTQYIYNNIRSLFTLRSYTYRGDEIVNAYLRKSTKNYRMILQNIRISGKEIPFSYIIYDNYDFLKKAGLIMPEKNTLISSDKINNWYIISNGIPVVISMMSNSHFAWDKTNAE